MQKIIETIGLCKKFPGVQALDDVDFSVGAREVHAIVGENGAGKSTLIKILGGVYQADRGKVIIDGQEVHIKNPLEARGNGIIVIFQELSLVPYLNVAENIFLGRLPRSKGIIDKEQLFLKTNMILKKLDCPLKAEDYVGKLSSGKKQLVEIARALAYEAKIIIFDEPTASLGVKEIEILFKNINRLKERGASILYITHKLDEVFSISDNITVMRDGKIVSNLKTSETNEEEVVKLMIGRNIKNYYIKAGKEIQGEVLRVKNFTSDGVFSDINFTINKGEIVGFYGLVGAGRTELMRSIFGIDNRGSGDVFLEKIKVHIRYPLDAVNLGIALVPEERKEEGLVLQMSVIKNINLVKIREATKGPFISRRKQLRVFNEFKEKFSIKTSSDSTPVQYLSGGNQQKVVLSKWLSTNPKVLILDEPTKGIDVGSKAEIHRIIEEMAKKGIAVIVISSEMPEIIGLSDRVITMCEGRITGNFIGKDINEKNLMYAIAKNLENRST
ncbi:D-xylose ABC transporter ATP-binding protein [Candidatus Atribacteria bacterium HGW-Atribacteria-1]|nr:MAG: D-xylose ABC transporter ATP-binding protein [Candidatus Atribacteria bacterium HGW-Atribacteria-1]